MPRSLSRAARLRKIENLLYHNTQGLKITEIADACAVTRRTIYRDIDLLTDAEVPIWEENGRYGIIRDQYLATIRLGIHEAAVLYIATRLLSRHADQHNPHIVSALNKIATAFPDPLATHIAKTAKAVRERPYDPDYLAILEALTLSWAETRKIHVWYRSPRSGNLRPRTLSPYLLEPSTTGGLYVIGHDEWANDIRTFKLDRLEKAELLTENYTIPDDFELKSHLAGAWGIMTGNETEQVILRFSPAVAPYIKERRWHSSQQLFDKPDGSIRLELQIADSREMLPWIRSWGSEVEILDPASLRQTLSEEAQKLYALYTD